MSVHKCILVNFFCFLLFKDKYQESQRETSIDKQLVVEELEEKRREGQQNKDQKWEETICKQ